jgi:hypothetical protein
MAMDFCHRKLQVRLATTARQSGLERGELLG